MLGAVVGDDEEERRRPARSSSSGVVMRRRGGRPVVKLRAPASGVEGRGDRALPPIQIPSRGSGGSKWGDGGEWCVGARVSGAWGVK